MTRGILDAHRRGVVRSTSLLVTFPGAPAAAEAARAERELEVGLHVDLVGGAPVSDPSAVPSLVGADGRFLGLDRLVRALARRALDPRHVAREVRAQAERARALGITPLAWDSHRHVHAIPLLARVIGAVAREEHVRWLRRPRGAPGWRGWKPVALRLATAASEVFYRGIPGNDWYVDLSSWRPPDATAIALLATRPGIGEIGAHPGYADDELRRADTLVERRDADLALLTDPLLCAALREGAVRWRVDA